MSFEAIERKIATWDSAQLRKLQALLAVLTARLEDPEFDKKLARRIDDRTAENWLTSEEFARRLGLSPDE